MTEIFRSLMNESDVKRAASTKSSMDNVWIEFFPEGALAGMEDHRKRQKLEIIADSMSRDYRYAVKRSDLDVDKGLVKLGGRKSEVERIPPVIPCLDLSISLRCRSPSAPSASRVTGECPPFGVVSVRGRRRDMEDAVDVCPSFCLTGPESNEHLHYFAVYDGHGCSHVARKCKERLHNLVKEELEKITESAPLNDWKSVMESSFRRMDKEVAWYRENVSGSNCRCLLQPPECDRVGSTAVAAILTPEKIIVSNCGDSRAVLCRSAKPVPLSSDHKPDRPDELNRIQAAGGQVIYIGGARVLGVLATSRAIGDDYLKPYLSSEPEVTITDRTAEDDCLIIGSDGLWDVVSNETACEVAQMCLRERAETESAPPHCYLESGGNKSPNNPNKECTDAATLLTKLALARRSSDNVSVVVVDLKRGTLSAGH